MHTADLICKSFILSIADYCSDSAWSRCGKTNIELLEKQQRWAARILMKNYGEVLNSQAYDTLEFNHVYSLDKKSIYGYVLHFF